MPISTKIAGPKTDCTGTYNTGDAIEVTGAGTRMFFNPKKAAFRSGSVTGTQWDDASIGDYSTAMGYSTMASGLRSTAMGSNTTASGYNSTAMGYNTTASDSYSTAMGNGSTASGSSSTAMGAGTTASGDQSTAIGAGATSSGVGRPSTVGRLDGPLGGGLGLLGGSRCIHRASQRGASPFLGGPWEAWAPLVGSGALSLSPRAVLFPPLGCF